MSGDLLRSVGIFADLRDSDRAVLEDAAKRLRLAPGEKLMRQGDSGNDLYVVVEGRFRVSRRENGQNAHLGEVLPGECVGETALLRDVPRTATVTAIENSAALAVPGKLLREHMDSDHAFRDTLEAQLRSFDYRNRVRQYRPSGAEVVGLLARMLPGTSPSILKQLEPQVQWVAVPRDTVVMRQGHVGDDMFFVVSGRLCAFAERDDGTQVQLGGIGPGESVGEIALLSNGSRTVSVRTDADCELLRLSKEGFDRLLANDPAASAALARMMAERLQERLHARSFVAQLRTVPLVSEKDCTEVVETPHLVLRNLKVTETYYRLSIGMTLLTGHQDVSWLTFACHASKTVGMFVRGDAIPLARTVAFAARMAPTRRAAKAVRARLTDAASAVAELCSEGNIKVFGEIGPVLARMTAEFHEAREYDRDAFARFVDGLALRKGPSDAGGQDTLCEALAHYYDAMFQPDAKRKAELILLANFKVGLHEQNRLQPHIEGAMNVSTDKVFAALGSRALVNVARDPITRAWRHFATWTMMRYQLPYGAVPVSGGLPVLPTRRVYPDVLTNLDHPELRSVAQRYGAASNRHLFKSRDWANLDQRMTFIFELFRTRQRSLELFDPPFLHQQRLAIATNRLPAGPL